MSYKTRMRAKLKGDFTEVKVLIKHPMKTKGKDRDGKVTEAHYIEEVICTHNGQIVMSAEWGGGVSANPYLAFQFEGGKVGESVKLTWKDNQGNSGEADTTIK
ncbi:MAG: thiosulfate oxidation carrier complex protein SoxZ [Pseudomonadota bacterium]